MYIVRGQSPEHSTVAQQHMRYTAPLFSTSDIRSVDVSQSLFAGSHFDASCVGIPKVLV